MYISNKIKEFFAGIIPSLGKLADRFKKISSFIYRNFLSVIFFGFIVNNLIALHQRIHSLAISPDEIDSAHNSWSVFNGLIIYKDFFDFKAPLFTFLNSFLISIAPNSVSFDTLLFLREFHFIALCSAGLLIYFIAREFKLALNASILSVAIFYMWDAVISNAHEIKPEGLQTFFMLLAFLIFIKSYQKYDKALPFFCIGLSLGLMFFIGFNSIVFLLAFLIYSLSEIIVTKDSKNCNKFGIILLGLISIFVLTSMYFLYKGGYMQFHSLYFIYNLDLSSIPKWIVKSTAELREKMFLGKDFYLCLISLFGILTLSYSHTRTRLLLISLVTGVYFYLMSFYPEFAFVFLPFASIFAASFVEKFLLHAFYESTRVTVKKLGVLFSLYLLLAGFSGNLLKIQKETYKTRLENQEANLNWALRNIPRGEQVAFSKHACPAYIFNKDIRYYRKTGFHENKVSDKDLAKTDLLETITAKQTKYFFIHKRELRWTAPVVKEYLYKHFDMLKLFDNPDANCIWVRKSESR